MPSDTYTALCLSALDRLSAHVPEIISTSELEALRSVLNEAAEFDSLFSRVAELEAELEESVRFRLEAQFNDLKREVLDERDRADGTKKLRDLFLYDAPIGTALILLRDATLRRPEEHWLRAAIAVLNELFKHSPDLLPWKQGSDTEDSDETKKEEMEPERRQILDRFEEAAAVYRIPGDVAMRVERYLRRDFVIPDYARLQHLLGQVDVNREMSDLVCDLVFMQDGHPDEKKSGFTEDAKRGTSDSPSDFVDPAVVDMIVGSEEE